MLWPNWTSLGEDNWVLSSEIDWLFQILGITGSWLLIEHFCMNWMESDVIASSTLVKYGCCRIIRSNLPTILILHWYFAIYNLSNLGFHHLWIPRSQTMAHSLEVLEDTSGSHQDPQPYPLEMLLQFFLGCAMATEFCRPQYFILINLLKILLCSSCFYEYIIESEVWCFSRKSF